MLSLNNKYKKSKKRFIIEGIIFFLIIFILISHLIYRNGYEKRGWLVFDGAGSAFLVRDKDTVLDYVNNQNMDAIFYEPHIANSLGIYNDEYQLIFQFELTEYNDTDAIQYLDIDGNKSIFDNSKYGSYKIKIDTENDHDTIKVYYNWVTTIRGNHYLVVCTSSMSAAIRLAIDTIFSYSMYIIIGYLLIHSFNLKTKLNMKEYEIISLSSDD